MDENKRVSSDVYEELKMLAALRERCVLQVEAANGGTATLQTTLADVFEDADGQYLLAENGVTLPLHQVRAINGKPLEPFC